MVGRVVTNLRVVAEEMGYGVKMSEEGSANVEKKKGRLLKKSENGLRKRLRAEKGYGE